MTPKVQETKYKTKAKIHRWDGIKLKNFCKAKETINKNNMKTVGWDKIFENHICDKGLISKTYKELIQYQKQKQITNTHTNRNLPAVQEMGAQSLGQEDPLEKEMATHSSIPPWRTENPDGLQSMGSQKSWNYLATKEQHIHTYIYIYHKDK